MISPDMKTSFDFERFNDLCEISGSEYLAACPYPNLVIDGLFSKSLLDGVSQEIEERNFFLDRRELVGEEVKIRSDFANSTEIPSKIYSVLSIMNSGLFLEILSKLTNIKGLITDPYFDGGGVNIIEPPGHLGVHVDGTHHARTGLCRRLNAILFLNKNWDPRWGGEHEQWTHTEPMRDYRDEQQRWRLVNKIEPLFGRLLVFTTNDFSWHGHSRPLSAPKGVTRKSLICYYYSVDRPESDLQFESPHRALFVPHHLLKDAS